MNATNTTSRDILKDLKSENNKAFGELYKRYFDMVKCYVLNNSGQLNDAEDVFQDAMIVLLEKLRHDNFILTSSLKTYIMAISKNLWLKRLRGKNQEFDFSKMYQPDFFTTLEVFIEEEKSYWEKVHAYINRITGHCRQLINDMFFKEKTIEEIQKKYGYTTRHNAQNQKHKCIEQIRRVKEHQKGK